ncbi:hypothetical protein OAP51_03785 [Alphaproteobacteria bacterium]|nr:hypothetical protein [Alphaproteobacteria bacterium]
MRLLSNNKNKYDLGSISFLENKETFFSYYYFLINKILDDRRLYQIYQNLSSNIDLEVQNYVFFAMQVQPERSSYPLAGVFDDQITSIKMLSDSIPNNWKVFVKEHPKLLRNPNLTSKNYRSHEYYSFINSLPNVELVSIDVESKELIDNAQAVFTATGSVGWEALLQSKKVGVFGFPWYLGCSTIFEIRTKKDIKKLLDYSMSTELVDRSLMEYFITYSDLFFTGARDYNFTDKNDENYDFLVSNFAESIKNFKKYQKRWIKLS